jgi:uncharacterized caspase-like protein
VEQFYEKLEEFQRRAQQALVGLFYYAGHGMEESGRNYLIPVGATLDTKTQLNTQTVSLEHCWTVAAPIHSGTARGGGAVATNADWPR